MGIKQHTFNHFNQATGQIRNQNRNKEKYLEMNANEKTLYLQNNENMQ